MNRSSTSGQKMPASMKAVSYTHLPVLAMGKVTALLYERFKAGKLPLTVQSMDCLLYTSRCV